MAIRLMSREAAPRPALTLSFQKPVSKWYAEWKAQRASDAPASRPAPARPATKVN